ncbi:MAG TPA: NADP-dependent phosphogluconate dehydrogenase [Patescibacteria group bacterium]|nr:NADP-dependent phosphogluconate dehydrogenase [Patescibacteria group bacterium]
MALPELAAQEVLTAQQHDPMSIVIVGLGKMGARMGAKLVTEGHEVYGWDINPDAREVGVGMGMYVPETLEEALYAQPDGDRIIWQMLPAGVTEAGLDVIAGLVNPGDIVIDGGNSKYQDTERNAARLGERGIRFLGIGVSGGIKAAETGYPLMVGGDQSAYNDITPILDSLSRPNGGHEYFGAGGAGHFVKMVHNGIEYPIMQAIGEGFGVMREGPYALDLLRVARLYQRNTLVSGFMMDITAEALAADPDLASYSGEIGSASGEALWTVEEAARLGVPSESIEQAIDFRRRSATDPDVSGSFAAKVVAAQRATFGGHPVKRA